MQQAKAQKRFFVVDGGPGMGKTSVINELARRGCEVFREGARAVLTADERFRGKDAVSVAGRTLQNAIWDYEYRRYQELLRREKPGDFFFDRGLYDGLAYAARGQFVFSKARMAQARRVKYHKIFMLAPLPRELYLTDGVRTESYAQALHLHQLLLDSLRPFEVEVVKVPFDTVARRANFLLEHLSCPSCR